MKILFSLPVQENWRKWTFWMKTAKIQSWIRDCGKRIQIPDYAHLLPKEIASFTTNTVYNNENTHLSFTQGGGHGGSHPHLVHEFIRSILEERKPAIDDIMGAYWTGTGICAHESAMKGGEVITIPRFE